MSNIAELFFQAADRTPDRPAIIHRDLSITYGELAAQVSATAADFRGKGLATGDRVLVLVPMGIDLYRIVLALFSIGAGAVFLDAWVNRKRMELCCELAQCRGFVGSPKARLLALLSRPLRRIPLRFGTALPPMATAVCSEVDADATALITFTTGSTGAPKAARRSHGFLAAQFNALMEELGPSPDEVVMTTLPIVLFMALGMGRTSVIPDFKPQRPETFRGPAVIGDLLRHKVNRLIASPSQVLALCGDLRSGEVRIPTLTHVTTGGAPVFPREAERMSAALASSVVRVVYGSTECEPISSIDARVLATEHAAVERGSCVGAVSRHTALRIIRIDERPIPTASPQELQGMVLPTGQVGEILVSGHHVLTSYFNNEEAFRRNKIVVDGTIWHRTGDSGFLDGAGRLFLCGRCEQLIAKGNDVLAPFVLENRLALHEGVVHGTILQRDGRVIAVVQAAPGADQDGLRASLLAAHRELDAVAFIRRMPMDPRHRSKIDHALLRDRSF